MRYLIIALVLVAGCKKSREKECDELAQMGIALADGLAKGLGGKASRSMGADPEIKAKMAEFRAQCMTWPDEVFECMRDNDETSPKCREAMSKVTGLVSTDATKAPAGPPIAASAMLGEGSWEGIPVTLAIDGTLTAAPKGAIVAFAPTGTERWRAEMAHDGWLLTVDGAILAGDRDKHELVALDAQTGAERWRAAVPQGADEYSDRSTEGAVKIGKTAFVAIADGRFLRVDVTCPKKQNCIAPAFAMADETFDDVDLLAIGDETALGIVLGESNAIRRISPTGKVLATIHVRDSFGGFASAGHDRIAAIMDDELVIFDLARCTGGSVALPRKAGRMYIRGEGECEDCIAPPSGCLAARSELSDVSSQAPGVLRDGSLVADNFDGPARVAPSGVKRWATEIDSVGPIREVGDNVVFISRGDDDQPALVVALSTETGKAKWSRPLPQIKSSTISSTTDPIVEVAGTWLVAGAKGNVAWIDLARN